MYLCDMVSKIHKLSKIHFVSHKDQQDKEKKSQMTKRQVNNASLHSFYQNIRGSVYPWAIAFSHNAGTT